MRKLATLFAFFVITGMMTACGESPVGVGELETPEALSELAREIDCEGFPTPNSLVCGDEAGEG